MLDHLSSSHTCSPGIVKRIFLSLSFWYITARVTLKVGKGVEGDDEAWLAFLLVSNCEDRILLHVKMNSSSLQVDNTFQEMGIIGHWKVNQLNYNHKQDSSLTWQ